MTLTQFKLDTIQSMKICPIKDDSEDFTIGFERGVAMYQPGLALFRIDTGTDFHKGIVKGWEYVETMYNDFVEEGIIVPEHKGVTND